MRLGSAERRRAEEELALEEELERREAQKITGHRWVPQVPTEKQRPFVDTDAHEVGYGGAAGGGKSSALLMAALKYVHVPKYAAILMRRTYADLILEGALMDRARDWLTGTSAKWRGAEKKWEFPSGASLSFGYWDKAGDRERYKSAEFQFIGIDQVEQWPLGWYTYMFSRLRKTVDIDVPLRMRASFNPGGIGHEWVKRRFVDEATRGERVFIPAQLEDMKGIVDIDAYELALSELDATTYEQLRKGKWIRDSGSLVYGHFAETRSVIPVLPLPIAHKSWTWRCGLDFGTASLNAIAVVGNRDHDRIVYIPQAYQLKGLPDVVADEVKKLEKKYGFARIVGDLGGLGKTYGEEMRDRFNVPVEAADKTNKRGYQKLLNGALAKGEVKIVREGCADLIEQWSTLPLTEDGEREVDGFENHAADAALYAWRDSRAHYAGAPPRAKTEEDIEEDMRRELAGEHVGRNWR